MNIYHTGFSLNCDLNVIALLILICKTSYCLSMVNYRKIQIFILYYLLTVEFFHTIEFALIQIVNIPRQNIILIRFFNISLKDAFVFIRQIAFIDCNLFERVKNNIFNTEVRFDSI